LKQSSSLLTWFQVPLSLVGSDGFAYIFDDIQQEQVYRKSYFKESLYPSTTLFLWVDYFAARIFFVAVNIYRDGTKNMRTSF